MNHEAALEMAFFAWTTSSSVPPAQQPWPQNFNKQPQQQKKAKKSSKTFSTSFSKTLVAQ
jgi:hypothetical protein